MSKDKILSLLQGIELDFSNQINSLRSSGDYAWDCHDIDNWQCSHESVMELAKLLKVEIANNIEEEDESNRT